MATEGTDRQSIRVYAELWKEFGRVAEPNRTVVLVAYIKRYIKNKGGVVPPEPARKRGPKRRTPAES